MTDFRLGLRNATAMRLALAAPGRLQARVQVHWPGTVVAGSGIAITQIGATYTVALDPVGAHLLPGIDFQPFDADLTALAGLSATGILVRTAANIYALRSLAAPAAGLTITNPAGLAGDPTFALANDLAALEALASSGFAARTGADTWAIRSLAAPAAGLTITNPAGTAGDPTFALAHDLAALEGLAGTGIAVRTAADTWAQRTVTGTANEITVANGDGVAGNPALSLPAALTFTGKTVTGGTFASPTSTGTDTISEALALTGDISPASIGADQNDYNPTGLATASTLRLTSSGAFSLTGLAGGADGRILIIHYVGANSLTLKDENVSSSAGNRFALTGDVTLTADMAVMLQYDSTSSRWRMLGSAGGGGGFTAATQADMEAASSTTVGSTPGRQHFHPGHPKCWAFTTVSAGTPTLQTSYNITSITDTAVGRLTITIATDFSTANWSAHVTIGSAGDQFSHYSSILAGSLIAEAFGLTSGVLEDPTSYAFAGHGDHV